MGHASVARFRTMFRYVPTWRSLQFLSCRMTSNDFECQKLGRYLSLDGPRGLCKQQLRWKGGSGGLYFASWACHNGASTNTSEPGRSECCEHLRSFPKCSGGLVLLCHDPLWVRLPTICNCYGHGLANLCWIDCRSTALQWVWLSGCFAKKSPSRTDKMDQNGWKWMKMDENGYRHLDMLQMVQIFS